MVDYKHGTMDVSEQTRTFGSFIGLSIWAGGLTVLTILLLTLIFAAQISWMVAIIVTTIVGVLMGLALGRGAGWYATVIGFAAISFFSAVLASLIGSLL